jgi:hypothetical protein
MTAPPSPVSNVDENKRKTHIFPLSLSLSLSVCVCLPLTPILCPVRIIPHKFTGEKLGRSDRTQFEADYDRLVERLDKTRV